MPICTLTDIEAIETIPLAQRNLPASTYAALRDSAAQWPHEPALQFFAEAASFTVTHDWTYRQLVGDITRMANVFHSLGIGSTDVVAFVLPNLPETHFVIWGGEAAGIVMAVNPLLEAVQLGELLRVAAVKVVVTLAPTPGSDLWSKVLSQLTILPAITAIVWVSMAPYVAEPASTSLRQLAARERELHSHLSIYDMRTLMATHSADDLISGRKIAGSDISSYFCTGGTTGLPKIAVRTHGCEVADVWSMSQNIGGAHRGQVYFNGLPLFHVNGQLITGLLPWMGGACVILATPQGYRGPGVLDRFWEMVEQFRISFFSGVPTIFSALLSRPIGTANLSTLQFAICGAAPMPVELFRQFERTSGLRILEGYGLTEGGCASSVNPAAGERRVGSVGFRLPYQKMRAVLLDEGGLYLRDANVNEAGVIVIAGPNVFRGYLDSDHNHGIWVEIEKEHWLNTGDLGRQDAEGYFWLTGRKKELIIRGGHNIDPRQIEEAIQAHPDVALVAAIGSPDAHAGEVPVAYVQLVPGATVDPASLLAFASAAIHERPAVPKRIEIIASLPLTSVGKISKLALQILEIERTVRAEAAACGCSHLLIKVVQDARCGILVRIAGQSKVLSSALARYTFAVDWGAPS